MSDQQRADMGMAVNTGRVRQVRLLAIAASFAVGVLVTVIVTSLLVLEQRQRDLEAITAQQDRILAEQEATFCDVAWQTRGLFARVLSALAKNDDDTPADDARQRRQADAVLAELRALPDDCNDHVDPEDIEIDVGWAWQGPPLRMMHNRWYGSRTIPSVAR